MVKDSGLVELQAQELLTAGGALEAVQYNLEEWCFECAHGSGLRILEEARNLASKAVNIVNKYFVEMVFTCVFRACCSDVLNALYLL
ncbi:hypothetical protein V3C99_014925 [Haemonchus contortus]